MNRKLITEVEYDNTPKIFKAIELGAGDVTIFDITIDSVGRSGIGFKVNEGFEVGESAGIDGMQLDDVTPDLIIITSNVKSLEVLLDKVQKAIAHLENDMTEEANKNDSTF